MPNDIQSKIDKAKKAGYSEAQINSYMQQKGIKYTIPQKPLIERAGDFVSRNNLPGSKLGENLGTSYAALKAGLQGNMEGATAISQSAPTGKQIAGDVARSAAIPVSLAAPNPLTFGGAIAQFGALGAISGAGEAATQNANVARGALQGGALGVAGGILAKGLEKAVSTLGKVTGKAGEKITSSIIRPSKVDLEDGFNIDTVKKFNLGGSLPDISTKTDEAIDRLTAEVNRKYAQSASKLDINKVLEQTIKQTSSGKVNSFGSNASMENAINWLKNEVTIVTPDGLVSVPDAVQIKRATGHYGAWLYGAVDPDSTARQKLASTFYRNLKESIEQASPEGVKEINKQISELIPVMNAVIRRIPVAQRDNTISLTDIIALTGSTIEPKSMSVFLLNQLSKSGRVGNILMKTAPSIEASAPAATPLIRGAVSGLQAALPQDTQTPQQSIPSSLSPSQNSITEEEARKVMDMATGAVPALTAAKTAKLATKALAGFSKQETKAALKQYRQYLIDELQKGHSSNNPSLKLEQTVSDFVDMLQTLRSDIDMDIASRGALLLRSLGNKTTKTIADFLEAMI